MMFNIALAVAFALSSLLSPGRRILQLVVDGPVFQSLPPYQGHLLLAFANYWLPAIVIYLLLRISRAESWLRTNPKIHGLLGLANVLLILYVASRTLASTVQGGGASFVVMSFAPFVIFPAWALLAMGLVLLAVHSIRYRNEQPQVPPSPLGVGGVFGIVAAIGLPAAVGAWVLLLDEKAPFRLAAEAEQLFRQRCVDAGEKILEVPQDVQSVYLEPDGAQYFDRISNGVYTGYGSSILGEPLVNSGWLRYFEKQNFRAQSDGTNSKYRKHEPNDWKGEPIEELTSEYGVFQKSLLSDIDEKRLGVHGTEVRVMNLKTQRVTATLTYFTSSRNRTICGHSGGANFSVSEFVTRSLNLSRRVSGAIPQDGGVIGTNRGQTTVSSR